MNAPRGYKSLTSLAEHLAAMLDDEDALARLEDELDILQLDLEELLYGHISTNTEEREWAPHEQPSSQWTPEDIAFIAIKNRMEAVSVVKRGIESEAELPWQITKKAALLVPMRLKNLLLKTLESMDTLECPSNLVHTEALLKQHPRSLEPKKLPIPIQALQLQEIRLAEILTDESLNPRLREVASNQYHVVWQLKTFLISELFPTEENLLGDSASRKFLLGLDWMLLVAWD